MDRSERFYKIDQLLRERSATPLKVLMEVLEVSRATVKRDLEYLRDRMGAPIVWDRATRGYRYAPETAKEASFSLPGLWFNASEIYALLTMDQLLSSLQPGLLSPHIQPLRRRVQGLLEQGAHSMEEIAGRVRISQLAQRPVDARIFQTLAAAVLGRQRVVLRHYNRARDEVVVREVSPQRLVWYRGNWYLDAWCHLRNGLRSFGMDVIRQAEATQNIAREVPADELDAVHRAGYGIFSRTATRKAVLRFSRESARWGADERWHSQQQGCYDDQGRYLLTLPYASDIELIMDIQRYGPEVEVLEPPSLRQKVKVRLERALRQYQ